MTDKELDTIAANINNDKHLDYYTAWLMEHLISTATIEESNNFKSALKTASQTEIDTFIKVLSCLHGSISELYKQSNDKSLHIETETAIKEHFFAIGDLVKEADKEAAENDN